MAITIDHSASPALVGAAAYQTASAARRAVNQQSRIADLTNLGNSIVGGLYRGVTSKQRALEYARDQENINRDADYKMFIDEQKRADNWRVQNRLWDMEDTKYADSQINQLTATLSGVDMPHETKVEYTRRLGELAAIRASHIRAGGTVDDRQYREALGKWGDELSNSGIMESIKPPPTLDDQWADSIRKDEFGVRWQRVPKSGGFAWERLDDVDSEAGQAGPARLATRNSVLSDKRRSDALFDQAKDILYSDQANKDAGITFDQIREVRDQLAEEEAANQNKSIYESTAYLSTSRRPMTCWAFLAWSHRLARQRQPAPFRERRPLSRQRRQSVVRFRSQWQGRPSAEAH